jgi:hypothetical protein
LIEIHKISENEFKVRISEGNSHTEHRVILDDDYYRELTQGEITREELIKKSFEFLLDRESKESILSRFELNVINRYFPEYEGEMKK